MIKIYSLEYKKYIHCNKQGCKNKLFNLSSDVIKCSNCEASATIDYLNELIKRNNLILIENNNKSKKILKLLYK